MSACSFAVTLPSIEIGATAIGERVCDFLCPPHRLLHAPDIQLQMLQRLEHRGAVGQKLSNPFDDAAFDLSRRNTNAVRGICAAPGDQTTGYVVAISLTALDRMRWHQAIARLIV